MSLLKFQNSRCAICREFSDELVIDHNHKTNKVRGLLCDSCNIGIGFLRENIINFGRAIRYLHYDGNTNDSNYIVDLDQSEI